jgi:hypothetical protein
MLNSLLKVPLFAEDQQAENEKDWLASQEHYFWWLKNRRRLCQPGSGHLNFPVMRYFETNCHQG